MTTIHLKRYYRHLAEDITLVVPDEIAVTLSIGGRLGDSFKRRKRSRGECSLDTTPGFEADVTTPPLTPDELMERQEAGAALYRAIDQLPPVQARRVYARYILGISVADLARSEGVSKAAVSTSIDRALLALRNYFQKNP